MTEVDKGMWQVAQQHAQMEYLSLTVQKTAVKSELQHILIGKIFLSIRFDFSSLENYYITLTIKGVHLQNEQNDIHSNSDNFIANRMKTFIQWLLLRK